MNSDLNVDISVKHVGMIFQKNGEEVVALNDVNFEIEPGKLFCLVGPSGCGKSTLLKIMLNLLIPTKGEVWLNPIRKNAGIAYIQQSSLLLPWRTLMQNASLGAEIRDSLNDITIDRIKNEIKVYGLEGFEDKLPNELSGGMKQRVDIIRSLESRPKLLLCDEPFSSIDFVTRLEMNTRFKKMCRIHGITTVFVTHNIEEAIFLGDIVGVMCSRPGKIVSIYKPKLSKSSEDAVKCRESPEFSELFMKIWEDLKIKNETKS